MRDRREELLARLGDVLAAVPGIVKFARNVDDISAAHRPAAILHDGATSLKDTGAGGAANSQAQMMRLSPQIYLLLGAPSADLGPLASALCVAIVAAVLKDTLLVEMVGGERRRGIIFEGAGLETVTGETREGRFEISISFDYPFAVSELT